MPERNELPYEQAGIDMTDDEVVAVVGRHLAIPSHEVKAIKENMNEIHEKVGAQGVQAYAKLSGNGWTFYIKRLMNIIGRPPEASGEITGAADYDDGSDKGVHINLGPNKMISRHHSTILYNADTEKWMVSVSGRNGVKVNGSTMRKGEITNLSSGTVLEIGGVEMMFVLPVMNEKLTIHKMYLVRAALIQESDDNTEDEDDNGDRTGGSSRGTGHRERNGIQGGLLHPIAPAPADYKRPGTPPSGQKSSFSSKSPYVGGTMVMSSDDIDLSIDQNKHIKPTFSYAQLITQAILKGEGEKQTLSNIYKYITDRFAYYRFQPAGGWQVSQIFCFRRVSEADCILEFDPAQLVSTQSICQGSTINR